MTLTSLWRRSWFGGVAWGVTLWGAAVPVYSLLRPNKSESMNTLFLVREKHDLCSGVNGVFPFCDEIGRLGCTVDRLSVAQCNRRTPAASSIDSQFQVHIHIYRWLCNDIILKLVFQWCYVRRQSQCGWFLSLLPGIYGHPCVWNGWPTLHMPCTHFRW